MIRQYGAVVLAVILLWPSSLIAEEAANPAPKGPAPCLKAIAEKPKAEKTKRKKRRKGRPNLEGSWIGDGSFIVFREDGSYHWWANTSQSEGTYKISKGKIALTVKGRTRRHPYALWGGALQISLKRGKINLKRQKVEKEKETPAQNFSSSEEIDLNGIWTNDDSILEFDKPRFCWRTGRKRRLGTYRLSGKTLAFTTRKEKLGYLIHIYEDRLTLKDLSGSRLRFYRQ